MGGAFWEKIIKVLVHERGFVYLLWLRLTSVKSPIRPVFWLIYHHLSSKYGIQISTNTNIGSGLYIGHGCGIIINPTAKNREKCFFESVSYYRFQKRKSGNN